MYEVNFMIDGMENAILKADSDYSLGHLIAAIIDGTDTNVVGIRVEKLEDPEEDDQGGTE